MATTIIEELCAGSELSIANAARRSFDTFHAEFTASDVNLLKYLIREGHWLPFRHPQLSFSCEAPVFVARQLGKHQIGMSWSEVSRRYKTENVNFWTPETWRESPENAKQGTGPIIPVDTEKSDMLHSIYYASVSLAEATYNELLRKGVAPEQARAVLPQSMLIRWTWTGSLLAWLHLIKERSHANTQTETREWVDKWIIPEITTRFPVTWEAFVKLIGHK